MDILWISYRYRIDIPWISFGDRVEIFWRSCSTPVTMRPEDHDLMVNRGPFSVRVTSLASMLESQV